METSNSNPTEPTSFTTNPLQHKVFANTRSVTDFERLDTLGEGTYGTVYSARDKVTGEIVAIKKVKIHDELEGFPITSLREIKMLQEIDHHVNIVSLREVVVGRKSDSIFLVFDYSLIDMGCLVDRMRMSREEMTIGEIKCLMLQLLNGMSFLHQNYIMHRDLKLSNLLMGKDGILKIADFGMSRKYEKPHKNYTSNVVTLWYRPPEILLESEDYDQSADIWSIGCIFAEFLQKGIPLFQGKNEVDQFYLICELIGYPSGKDLDAIGQKSHSLLQYATDYDKNHISSKFSKFGNKCVDLLNSILKWNPKRRMSINEIMVHPFFYEHPRPVYPEDMRFLKDLETYSADIINQFQTRKKIKPNK